MLVHLVLTSRADTSRADLLRADTLRADTSRADVLRADTSRADDFIDETAIARNKPARLRLPASPES